MESNEIRKRFLKFFEKRGHKIIPSASLVPENDPSVLFNIAGMQPLMPHLLGLKHPQGKRLANSQKCVRTIDLEEVGDSTHLTFFEMLGNWSLGDYFKEDAIKWSYEFLTKKDEGLGLDVSRLYVTVFGGSEAVVRDLESVEIWKALGIPEHRIYFKSSKSNWWSAGTNSPAGPSTEMFYDLTGSLGDMNQEQFEKAEDEQKVVEIWNDVFMAYKQEDGKVAGELPNKNVDTGAGLERVTTVAQGKKSIYETDIFAPVMNMIKENSQNYDERSARIIADHLRSSIFLISDGVIPGNKDQGYVLRRLIRRAVFKIDQIGLDSGFIKKILEIFVDKYKTQYSNILQNDKITEQVIFDEESKFRKTLKEGLKEFEKGIDPFILATTYGFPIELTAELAHELGKEIDLEDFHKKMAEHQRLSQTASAGMFKGGLANHNKKTIRLHTAHHLLLAGLQTVIGPEIKQRGSNITEERLRIDFLCDHKLTDEEKKKVENWVNEKIKRGLDVVRKEMPLEEAKRIGAEMEFGAKYADMVSVYFIQDKEGNIFSKEFCGGPHVSNTKELSKFKIQKEEAVAQGIRRIKAVLL
ncbi:alanine--tRNA ligase [Candidatus Nomurabacteria bacterium]|nr:alanine--tRNA ligase [Candidatus Nomurabacteria bacterium]